MTNQILYRNFLKSHVKGSDVDLPGVYHAVRNIPYGSTGERDPARIIANNLGSCSGKHILLRDLLRETGREAEVVTIFAHFNRGIPSHPAMPQDLRSMIEGEDISDYHQYVRAREGSRWIKLDATWHDRLIPYDFPVNHDWAGADDTVLAAAPIREYAAVEDVAAWKADLLAELAPEQRDARIRFFRRLTEWMMSLR